MIGFGCIYVQTPVFQAYAIIQISRLTLFRKLALSSEKKKRLLSDRRRDVKSIIRIDRENASIRQILIDYYPPSCEYHRSNLTL